jgi:hypothetical protein
MITVEIKADRGPFQKGETVTLPDDRAGLLISQGVARATHPAAADNRKRLPARTVLNR